MWLTKMTKRYRESMNNLTEKAIFWTKKLNKQINKSKSWHLYLTQTALLQWGESVQIFIFLCTFILNILSYNDHDIFILCFICLFFMFLIYKHVLGVQILFRATKCNGILLFLFRMSMSMSYSHVSLCCFCSSFS